MDYRPLEGFVFAVTPFNFTSIAGNLPTAPAMMGNTVVWKPASTSMLSAYYVMRLLEEAGLPPGVINLVYGRGGEVGGPRPRGTRGSAASTSPARPPSSTRSGARSAATSSATPTTRASSARPAARTSSSRTRRRTSTRWSTAAVRGAFEYQGQKCSAASRLFVPRSLWPEVRERLVADVESITMGDVADFPTFMGAVIDAASFATQAQAIAEAKADAHTEVVVGGECDDSVGYFVRPTVIVTSDPTFRTLREELFGPVLTTFVYDDAEWEDTLELVRHVDALRAHRRGVRARPRRRRAGGARRCATPPATSTSTTSRPAPSSGSSPSAAPAPRAPTTRPGSMWNLVRWVSPRAIKETFDPPTDYRYPFLAPDE